jgi:ubiquinone/menaquinone biosynthesis C-methylase UbiE
MPIVLPTIPDPFGFRTVRDAYDTVAMDYATHLPDTRAEAALDLAMVDAFADVVTSGDYAGVLDAGCGAGRMSRYLAERGCLVQGVDLSPGMVAMARRDHHELVFTVGSLTDLPCSDDQFAGVMLWYSIIHTPPAGLARTFAEASRVLRPGGHVLVGSRPAKGLATCPRRTAGSDMRSSWSVTFTRRTRSPRSSRMPACEKSAAWCDRLESARGTIRPC